jgi:PadR family transcriptional regulator, regulatory protein PadR
LTHGYGIGVRLDQISKGVFQVNAGSLFPALRRLERDGVVAGEWLVTENKQACEALPAHRAGAGQTHTRDP